MKTIAQLINWDFEANGSLEINDTNGRRIYYEKIDGYWSKRERDSQGNVIFFENSYGTIIDYRPKPCEDRVIEIDGVKYKLTKI